MPGVEKSATGLSVMAQTKAVHSDRVIPPEWNFFLLMLICILCIFSTPLTPHFQSSSSCLGPSWCMSSPCSRFRYSSRLPSFGPDWNWNEVPSPDQEPTIHLTSIVLAGLLPGLDRNLQFFGLVELWPWFHFTIATTLAVLWLQLSFGVLIIM
jgi:hypothetical protein